MSRPNCRTIGLRFMAGEDVETLARFYNRHVSEIEDALRRFLRTWEWRNYVRKPSRWVRVKR